MDMLTQMINQFQQAPLAVWLWVIPLTIIVWFIPSILALFFNRKHLKFIVLANIPAGFSFIAWGACIVWAVTGKVTEKAKRKMLDQKKPVNNIDHE